MNRQVYFIRYDLFKLVVALVLLVILIILLLQNAPPAAPVPVNISPTNPGVSISQPIVASQPAPTASPTTASANPPANAPEPTSTFAPTATLAPTEAPTPEPSSTPLITPTQQVVSNTVTTNSQTIECPSSMAMHLKVGDKVKVTRNLNMRSAPEISNNLILTNITGTQLEIIGGPVCGLFQGRAYVWWQVRRLDGKEGWSAEAPLNEKFYFLEIIQ